MFDKLWLGSATATWREYCDLGRYLVTCRSRDSFWIVFSLMLYSIGIALRLTTLKDWEGCYHHQCQAFVYEYYCCEPVRVLTRVRCFPCDYLQHTSLHLRFDYRLETACVTKIWPIPATWSFDSAHSSDYLYHLAFKSGWRPWRKFEIHRSTRLFPLACAWWICYYCRDARIRSGLCLTLCALTAAKNSQWKLFFPLQIRASSEWLRSRLTTTVQIFS